MTTARTHHDALVWGGYGFGNVGDELTLAVALHDLRARFGDSLAVLSRDVDRTRRLFPGVDVIPCRPVSVREPRRCLARLSRSWFRRGGPGTFHLPGYRLEDQPPPAPAGPGRWRHALAHCREFHLVGGGYLTDLFNLDSFLVPVIAARRANVPVVTAPLGLGPFLSRGAARHTAAVLRGATVCVRDPHSLAFCREHGVAATLRPDDGFRLLEALPAVGNAPGPAPGRPRVGVCAFRQHGDGDFAATRRWWVELLRALRSANVAVEGFCFHDNPGADLEVLGELFAAAGLPAAAVTPAPSDLHSSLGAARRFDVVIAARFHAIVTAHALGVPHFGIGQGRYYATKMAAAVRADDPRCGLVDAAAMGPAAVANRVLAVARSAAAPA